MLFAWWVLTMAVQLSATESQMASSPPPSPLVGATRVTRATRCPESCNGRGVCFDFGSTSPTIQPFPAICACDELWEGKACNRRQHNPYHACRERDDYQSWAQAHGVSCSSNTSAASCEACASIVRLCSQEGECVMTVRRPVMQCELRPLPSQRKRRGMHSPGAKLECGLETSSATGRTPPLGRRRQTRSSFKRMTSGRGQATSMKQERVSALKSGWTSRTQQRETQRRQAQQLVAGQQTTSAPPACKDTMEHSWCLKKLEKRKCGSHKVSQQCQSTCKICSTARADTGTERDGSSNGKRAGSPRRGTQFTRATIGGKAVGV